MQIMSRSQVNDDDYSNRFIHLVNFTQNKPENDFYNIKRETKLVRGLVNCPQEISGKSGFLKFQSKIK